MSAAERVKSFHRRNTLFRPGRPQTINLEKRGFMQVPEDRYSEIANRISSADSPVGINATKTHVLILYMLEEIENRLEKIEQELRVTTA